MEKFFAKYTVSQILIGSFIALIAAGTFLLVLPICSDDKVTFLEAFFTATSATCVTGLMTVSALEDFNIIGQTIILFLIQVGGLGLMTFVTLSMSIISNKLGLKEKTFVRESLNKVDYSDVRSYLHMIFKYTFSIEFIGFLILLTQFYDGSPFSIFQTLFLSVSAFCNAGIDVFGSTSLMAYDTNLTVNLTVCALIILGGLGFAVIFDITYHLRIFKKLRKSFRESLSIHSRLVLSLTGALIVSGMIFIFFFEYNNVLAPYGFLAKLEVSFFNSVTLRTAGFATVDSSLLNSPTKIIMIIYMLIGASPGGTGGGIKTTTFFLLLYSVYVQYKSEENMHIYKHHIHKTNFIKATSIFFLYLFCIVGGIIVLTSIETEITAMDLLFEVVSAIGTVGLSTGITADLCSVSKLVIIILMFIGRLGPITVALSFGHNKKGNTSIKYPKTEIIVG